MERDGKSVDEQLARSPKGMLLMQYLILAPRQTAEAKTLMQVMWPEENSTSPDTALKTLISRQRALLRAISPELAMCLVTVRGGYRWVCPPEVSVDVLEFEEMLARMKLPGGATPSEEMLTRMLVLYQGRLLADQQPQPAWLYNRSERLHQQFLQTVDSRLAQLQQAGYVHRYVALVRRAIDADPTNEALQQRLIEGLRQTERDTDADQQVELAARLNSAARDEMMADYYDRIQRANRALETGLVQFKEELMRGEDNNRAIVCDRRVFRSLFCLQRRGMERTGGHALLGILTLTELDPASEKREAALNGLVKIMLLNLRRGDVITRLDESTIAMFLPNADESAANIIIDRLKRSFYLQFPSTGRTLSCAISAISVEKRSRSSDKVNHQKADARVPAFFVGKIMSNEQCNGGGREFSPNAEREPLGLKYATSPPQRRREQRTVVNSAIRKSPFVVSDERAFCVAITWRTPSSAFRG